MVAMGAFARGRRFSLDLAHLYYVRSTLDVGEAVSKAGADAAISKDAPLPDIICSLRQLAG
jgi:hypothetical protein